MTVQSDFKKRIRERQRATGESYTEARQHLLRGRAEVLGEGEADVTLEPVHWEAIVLKVNTRSARVRVANREVTLRAPQIATLAPGQIARVTVAKRWTWLGDEYASGDVLSACIDIHRLGLAPLAVRGDGHDESFEMDSIAWGAFEGSESDADLVSDAMDLRDAGDEEAARELLMGALHHDLRCLDAHAALGLLEFGASPRRSLTHYEIGVRIGEQALGSSFKGELPWDNLFNRPFLRCLYGLGLCHWRLGHFAEAECVFKRLLTLNPSDNQNAQGAWQCVRSEQPWTAGDTERVLH